MITKLFLTIYLKAAYNEFRTNKQSIHRFITTDQPTVTYQPCCSQMELCFLPHQVQSSLI